MPFAPGGSTIGAEYGAPALVDLMTNRVQIMFTTIIPQEQLQLWGRAVREAGIKPE